MPLPGGWHVCEVRLTLAALFLPDQGAALDAVARDVATAVDERYVVCAAAHAVEERLRGRLGRPAWDVTVSTLLDLSLGSPAYCGLLAERLDARVFGDDDDGDDGGDGEQKKKDDADAKKLTYADVCALPEGLDAMLLACYEVAFPDAKDWARALPLVALILAARRAETETGGRLFQASKAPVPGDGDPPSTQAAREPLPVELAFGACRAKRKDLNRWTARLRPIFPVVDGAFVPKHRVYVDLLTWKEARHAFSVDADAARGADGVLRDYCHTLLTPLLDEGEVLRGGRLAIEAGDDLIEYAVKHFAQHALAARVQSPADVAVVERVLGNLRFVCVSARYGHLPGLVRELTALVEQTDARGSATLRDYKRWVLSNERAIRDEPTATYRLAANCPDGSAPREAFRRFMDHKPRPTAETRFVVERLFKPAALDPCLAVPPAS